jgi:hypothetical protein
MYLWGEKYKLSILFGGSLVSALEVDRARVQAQLFHLHGKAWAQAQLQPVLFSKFFCAQKSPNPKYGAQKSPNPKYEARALNNQARPTSS